MNTDVYLDNFNQRSIYDSNCLEFWAPVIDRVIPGVIPNRYYVSTFGNTYNSSTKKPIGLSMHRKGYYQFSVMTVGHKQKTKKLHRIIMETFCYFPGCENYSVNHIDSNRLNNNITNLEWITEQGNTIHGINNGYKKVFGNEYKVVLTDEDVDKIIDLYDNCDYTPNEIINILGLTGVSLELISKICHRKARLSYFNRTGKW